MTDDLIVQQAILVGVNQQYSITFENAMLELANLATACDIEVVGEITQYLSQPNSKYYLGTGKMIELKELAKQKAANLIIFNAELSPSQLRNIEALLEMKVIDRTMLILEIFNARAKTREAKIQVAIAQLQYFLPRLVGLRASLGRQVGGVGTQNKGLGEKQIDLDRRKIERDIVLLKRELMAIVHNRQTQRKWRKRQGIKTVALVGYTNAGKSSIMNYFINTYRLEQPDKKLVLAKDMLFATLQTIARRIDLPDKQSFILTDTVGFISNLPHHLVEAFKSTLEEIKDADLLLHIIDITDMQQEMMKKVTNDTLIALGADGIPVVYVYNKIDQHGYDFFERNNNGSCYVSAKTGRHMAALTETIKKFIFDDYGYYQLLVPYNRSDIPAFYHENVIVKKVNYLADGVQLIIHTTPKLAYKYKECCLLVQEIGYRE